MAKEPYDPEKVARRLFREEFPKKIGMVAFLEVTGVLMNWVRGANKRAKRAEAKLAEQPKWQRAYHELQAASTLLERRLDNALANSTALEQQLAACAKMNDDIMTALSKQETELKGQIEYFREVATAAVERGNALAALFTAAERVHKADLAMAGLGLDFVDPKPAKA